MVGVSVIHVTKEVAAVAKMGTGVPTVGRQVVFHATTGDHPAMVTRANPDGTLSLTVFAVGALLFRDNVRHVPGEVEDSDEVADRYGYWEWPDRVGD